jgi:hypothetical protein
VRIHRLAVDNMVQSRTVLAAIFHIAYIYGHRIRGCSDVVIEVNPRHVRFYRSMLGSGSSEKNASILV